MSTNYEDRDFGFEREYDRTMPRGPRRMMRRKICRFCIEKVDLIDYKDVKFLQSYVPERGKIFAVDLFVERFALRGLLHGFHSRPPVGSNLIDSILTIWLASTKQTTT